MTEGCRVERNKRRERQSVLSAFTHANPGQGEADRQHWRAPGHRPEGHTASCRAAVKEGKQPEARMWGTPLLREAVQWRGALGWQCVKEEGREKQLTEKCTTLSKIFALKVLD